MSREKQNDCVSCADGCHHCGRDKEYVLVRCDWCDEMVREEDFDKEDWHQITVKDDIGQVRLLYLCDDCYTTFDEALDTLMGAWNTFKAEHKGSWTEIQGIHTAQHKIEVIDTYLQELFDTWNG